MDGTYFFKYLTLFSCSPINCVRFFQSGCSLSCFSTIITVQVNREYLKLYQFSIMTIKFHQLLMISMLCNLTLMEHKNIISVPNGCKSMCNDNSGSSLANRIQSVLY